MMSKIIEQYYQQANIAQHLLKQKMSKFERYEDIKLEFEYWLVNRKYKESAPVTVNGYTAQKLAELSEYLDGEGAFMLLIELRDDPEKALKRISKGFVLK